MINRGTGQLTYLKAWAVGRPILVAMTAQRIALQGRFAQEFAELWGSGEIRRKAAALAPSDDRWLAMYRAPSKVKKKLIRLLASPNHDEVISFFANGAIRAADDPVGLELSRMSWQKLPHLIKVRIREEMAKTMRYQYQHHLQALAEDLLDEVPRSVANVDRAIEEIEMIFFILSVLPCAIAYGESAWDLYERSRQGERQAIHQLIRVDRRVLLDQQIAARAIGLGLAEDEGDRLLTAYSLSKEVALPLDPQRVNCLLAGMVGRLADVYGYKLDTKEIRDLLDAAEKDLTGDSSAILVDFPEAPEAQRQAIHRAKTFWKKLLPRDKDLDNGCHAEMGLMAVVSDDHASETRPTWLSPRKRRDPSLAELCRRIVVEALSAVRRM